MTISLLTAKAFLAPAAGVVAVGAGVGGSYYVYTNRSTSSSATSTNSTQQKTVVSSNIFLARVVTTPTTSTTVTSPLKCTIAPQQEVDCKVYKFNTTKANNVFAQFSKTDIALISAPQTDLVQHNYVVVELEGTAQTFDGLKNKTISLKHNNAELTTLHFDQLLLKSTTTENKEVYKALDAVTETYIVSTSATITSPTPAATGISGFRCKYQDTAKTGEIPNIDDSCKLFPIPEAANSKNISTLAEVKATTTAATALTASTFYRLTLNKNQLYNLDIAAAKTPLTVEIAATDGNKSGNVTIHQQLLDDKVVGSTDLLLAKFAQTTTTQQTWTESKCSFNSDPNQSGNTPFECNLHVASPTTGTNMTAFTITETATTSPTTLTAEHIFAIKLTVPKNVDDLTVGKNIYVHMAGTSSTKVTHQFEIKALLSGSITTAKKAFIIA